MIKLQSKVFCAFLGIYLLFLSTTFCGCKETSRSSSSSYEDYEGDSTIELSEEVDYLKPVLVCEKNGICDCVATSEKQKKPLLNCTQSELDTANITIKTSQDSKFRPVIVRLDHNRIGMILRGRILAGYEADIKDLDLSHNRIRFIERQAFDGFTQLRILRLSHNALRADEISNDWLSESLGRSLHSLNLGFNGIGTFQLQPGVFDNLINLKRLILDGNKGIALKKELFTAKLANLELLSLDHCDLDTLPDGIFDNLRSLKTLSLVGNRFSKVPFQTTPIPSLSNLSLSENPLVELPAKAFSQFPKLQRLMLRRMPKLTKVEDRAFCIDDTNALAEIKLIDLTDSRQLSQFSESAFCTDFRKNPIVLSALLLANCSLSHFSKQTLSEPEWKAMKQLTLEGNPLECDCPLASGGNSPSFVSNFWLGDAKLRKRLQTGELKCNEPKEVKGMPIEEAQKVLCRNFTFINAKSEPTPLGSSSYFFVILIVVIMSLALLTVGYIYAQRAFGPLGGIGSRRLPEFLNPEDGGVLGGNLPIGGFGLVNFRDERNLDQEEMDGIESSGDEGINKDQFSHRPY